MAKAMFGCLPIWSRKASFSDVEALLPCQPAVSCEPQLHLLDRLSAGAAWTGCRGRSRCEARGFASALGHRATIHAVERDIGAATLLIV